MGWANFLCGWGVFQDAKLPWRQRGANLTPNAEHTKLERNSVFPVADGLLARCAILSFSPILTLFFSMHLSSRRVLLQALAISVLIHSVILLSVVREFPARMDVPAATIRVLLGREVKGGGEKLVSKPLVTERAEPVRPVSPVVRGSPVPKLAAPEPSSAAVVASSPAPVIVDGVVAAAAAPVASGVGNTGSRTGALKAVPSNDPPRDGVSEDDRREYRMALSLAAGRFKRYPPLAQERGWEGTVEVELVVRALARQPEIALLRSSGHDILDEKALDMVTRAAHRTDLPAGLKGRDFRVVLPVEFSLADE